MAAESSFDVVSDSDQQELVNALDQVRREIATRFDFKGSRCSLELGKGEITLTADDEFRAKAVRDLVESKAVRRGLSLKVFDWGRLEPAAGGTVRPQVGLERGLTSAQPKELSKAIPERFPNVKTVSQYEPGRASGSSQQDPPACYR